MCELRVSAQRPQVNRRLVRERSRVGLNRLSSTDSLSDLDAQQLRALPASLEGESAERDVSIAGINRELHTKQTHIDQFMHGLAFYPRWRFGRRTEQRRAEQASLFEEMMRADMATMEMEIKALCTPAGKPAVLTKPRRLR